MNSLTKDKLESILPDHPKCLAQDWFQEYLKEQIVAMIFPIFPDVPGNIPAKYEIIERKQLNCNGYYFSSTLKINDGFGWFFVETIENNREEVDIKLGECDTENQTGGNIDNAAVKNPNSSVPAVSGNLPTKAEDNTNDPFIRALYSFIEGQSNEHTKKAYHHALKEFFGICKNIHPQKVNPEHIVYYKKNLQERQIDIATIELRLTAIKMYYQYLIDLKLLEDNPVKLKRVKINPYSRANKITIEMVQQLLSIIDKTIPVNARDYAILIMLLFTGRRISEILNIKYKDLRKENDKVYYTYKVLKKHNNSGDYRIKQLPPPVWDAINNYWNLTGYFPNSEDSLFISHSPQNLGKPLTYGAFYKSFEQLCLKAGLKFDNIDIHSFRHLRTEILESENVPIRKIQDELDHESPEHTLIYLSAIDKRKIKDDDCWNKIQAKLTNN